MGKIALTKLSNSGLRCRSFFNLEDLCSGSGSRVNQRSSHRYLVNWLDSQSTHSLDIHVDHYTKMLGMEWNATLDTFRPVVSSPKQVEMLTKRALLSDIARWLVLSSDCPAENSPPAHVEGKV